MRIPSLWRRGTLVCAVLLLALWPTGRLAAQGFCSDLSGPDLDRCRVRSRARRSAAATMLRRLERSLRKLGRAHARPLSPEEWASLREGWAERA